MPLFSSSRSKKVVNEVADQRAPPAPPSPPETVQAPPPRRLSAMTAGEAQATLLATKASSSEAAPSNETFTAPGPSAAAPTDGGTPESGMGAELRAHWPVLVVSCCAYVLLQAGNAFVPAITMVSASSDLGMSIATFGALNSVGAGIKSILIIFFMGRALEELGPHTLINWCLVGTALCNVGLAFCPGALSFSVVYLINYVFNSLSEQPAYVVRCSTDLTRLEWISSRLPT
jgi:hypothetical protein